MNIAKRILITALVTYILLSPFLLSTIPTVHANPDDTTSLIYYLTNIVNHINYSTVFSPLPLEITYYGYTTGNKTVADLQYAFDSLPVTNQAQAVIVLQWAVILEKFGITNQTLIQYALGNETMLTNGLPKYEVQSGQDVYHNGHSYLIRGFEYAEEYSYLLSKWNKTTAYNGFKTAVDSTANKAFLWVLNDNTTYSGWGAGSERFYDEFAETIGTFMEFYKLGISDALTQALVTWDSVNTHRWDDTYEYYHYKEESTPSGNTYWETEGGGFLEKITQLYYYARDMPNASRLQTDIINRFLGAAADWSAPGFSNTGTKYYASTHMNTGSTVRRLQNTEMAWAALQGLYSEFNSSIQTVLRTMMEGSAGYDPAWKLLMNETTSLFNSTLWTFRWGSDSTWSDYPDRATSLAADLMFMLGLVPQTGSLAIPIEENRYEYTFNMIDGDLYAINLNTHNVRLSIIQPGTIKFLWNASVTQDFNETGIWSVNFASDWNSITSAERTNPLPTNRKYLPGGLSVTAETTSNVAGASFYIDGAEYTTPDSRELTGQTHNFTASATFINATGTYTFTHWLVDDTYTYTSLTITPYIAENTTFYINYNPPSPAPPPSALPTAYYMRSDNQTVNTQNCNKLIFNENTETSAEVNASDTSPTGALTYQIGYRVFIVHLDGSETELTDGTPIATMTRASGTEYTNETWDTPYASLEVGEDALKITVYIHFGVSDWQLKAAFITPQLDYQALNSTPWTFSMWNTYTFDAGTNTTTATLRWDSDTYMSVVYGATFIPFVYIPPEYTYLPDLFMRGTTTTAYYMRSDTHTINGAYAYILNETESAASETVTRSTTSVTNLTAWWGFRFYLIYGDNSTAELTNGFPQATISRSENGSGVQSSIWLSPYVDFTVGNVGTVALKTMVYSRFGFGTWQLEATFVSDRLNYRTLMNTTWTISLYTTYTITQPSNYNLTATTSWGDTAHESRIEGIEFMNALPYELMTNDLGSGNLVGFLFRPYISLIGPGFYGLILVIIFYSLYRRNQSFTAIMVLFMLLGGAGGSILKTLIPQAGFEWGWILFGFGLAGFLYKVIRSVGSG